MLGEEKIPSTKSYRINTMIQRIMRTLAGSRGLCNAPVLVSIETYGRESTDAYQPIFADLNDIYRMNLVYYHEAKSGTRIGFDKNNENTALMTVKFLKAIIHLRIMIAENLVPIYAEEELTSETIETRLFTEMANWQIVEDLSPTNEQLPDDDMNRKKISGKLGGNDDDMIVALMEALYAIERIDPILQELRYQRSRQKNPPPSIRFDSYRAFHNAWVAREIENSRRRLVNAVL